MEINVFRRYEKKFLLNADQFRAMLEIIKAHMDIDPYCVGGKPYFVQTIYFDTSDNAIIRHSLSGPKFKEKMRIRHYGEKFFPSDPIYLEIKRKIEGVGTKRRVRLTNDEVRGFVEQRVLPTKEDYYSKQILSEIAYHLNVYDVRPAVYISYERLAFVSKDESQFRLTIDANLRTRRYDLAFEAGTHGDELIKSDHRLMEVKVGKAMPLWFAQALSAYNIYLTSFSKYGKEFEFKLQKEHASDEYI